MARAERSRRGRPLCLIAALQVVLAATFPATSSGQEAAVIVNVESGLVDADGPGSIAFDLLRRIYQGERANVPGQGRKRYEPLYIPPRECAGFEEILNTIYPPEVEKHLVKAHVQHIPTKPQALSYRQAVERVSETKLAFAIVDAAAIVDSSGSAGPRSASVCKERGGLPDNVKILKIDGHLPGAREYPLRVTMKAKTRG